MQRLLDVWAASGRVLDLGRRLVEGLPQSGAHPPYRLVLDQRHGDLLRPEGTSSASDLLVTGTHVGTHVDALGHVSENGRIHGELDVTEVQAGGRLQRHGIEEFEPFVSRGVLLDVAATLEVDHLPGDHEVTVDELEATVERQGTRVRPGDAVLIRTGWGRFFDDPERFVGQATGTPGPGVAAARWLAEHRVRVTGAETLMYEHCRAGAVSSLPVHRVLLVGKGIHLVEVMNRDPLVVAGCHEFLLVLAPLPLVGATGSPVRPLALDLP